MFVRPCWKPRTLEEQYELMDRYPWAQLVNNGPDGPFATNIPVLLDRSRGQYGTLVSHIARANAHARVLQESRQPSLVIFEGPATYVTGSWYPNRDMPSTFYYTAVHCYGEFRLQNHPELEHWLGVLTRKMEVEYPDGWKMTDVEHKDITRRLNHIVGFEIPIQRIEGKFKLGQDEPKKDAMAVAAQLALGADPSHRLLAAMVQRYNQDRSDS